MLPEQINQSDLLDILFADRNKSYGAYPLRKEYNKRLWTALVIMSAITALALAGYYTLGNVPFKGNVMDVRDSTKLVAVDILDKAEPPPPPPVPPPPPPPPQVSMRRFTDQFIIVTNDQATDVPPVDELDHARIGNINVDGNNTDDIVAPPVENNHRGIVELPRQNTEDKTFLTVQIESEYPGGLEAWKRFLLKTLRYPVDAVEKNIHGTVIVEFIVDKEGKVSNIKAVSGPEELLNEAVRVISKSGKWTVAIQNGNPVKSLKSQSITFQLANE